MSTVQKLVLFENVAWEAVSFLGPNYYPSQSSQTNIYKLSLNSPSLFLFKNRTVCLSRCNKLKEVLYFQPYFSLIMANAGNLKY